MSEVIEMLLRARDELYTAMNDIDANCERYAQTCLRCAIQDIDSILDDINAD